MTPDQEKFWNILKEPTFVIYKCDTCRWSNTAKTSILMCEKGPCTGYQHPRDNPKNKWEWDGKSYP